MRNYWQQQEQQRAYNFQARDQFNRAIEPPDLDSSYSDPRYSEVRLCPQGHQAHRKAGVGTFVCQSCGSLLAADGQWTAPRW